VVEKGWGERDVGLAVAWEITQQKRGGFIQFTASCMRGDKYGGLTDLSTLGVFKLP
jgi:hypothetical protein